MRLAAVAATAFATAAASADVMYWQISRCIGDGAVRIDCAGGVVRAERVDAPDAGAEEVAFPDIEPLCAAFPQSAFAAELVMVEGTMKTPYGWRSEDVSYFIGRSDFRNDWAFVAIRPTLTIEDILSPAVDIAVR